MVTKRDLVIAVLCTFCLTFTLFTILPTGSNNKTSGTGEYDPWLDYNDDGIVDYRDINPAARAFGTTGDPTKNVTVTNFPLDEEGNLRVNAVPRGNLTLCQDGQKIVVIDTYEKGLTANIYDSTNWWNVYESFFVFSPKEGFNNVTRVVFQAIHVANSSLAYPNFNISVGLDMLSIWRTDGYSGIPNVPSSQFCFRIESWMDPALGPYEKSAEVFCDHVKPGINIAKMWAKLAPGVSPCSIITYRVEIFIEYTYWDYVE